MQDFPIIDAHVHFWDLEQHRYPWLEPAKPSGPFGRTAAIRRTYLLDQYLEDAAGQNVTKLVHIEAGWDPADRLGEMRWVQALADRRGAPHAHIAHIDLADPDAAALIAHHAAFPLFRGVRDRLQQGDFTGGGAAHTPIDDPAWRKGMQALNDRGLCFDLQAPPVLAGKAVGLARAFPEVRFILTHAGYPPSPEDPAFAQWENGIRAMAQAPNIAVKLSGLMLGEKAWQPRHAKQAAQRLIAAFGSNRVLVASNFPVDRLFAPLSELFTHYRDWFGALPVTEQCKMLHDNARRLYRLGD